METKKTIIENNKAIIIATEAYNSNKEIKKEIKWHIILAKRCDVMKEVHITIENTEGFLIHCIPIPYYNIDAMTDSRLNKNRIFNEKNKAIQSIKGTRSLLEHLFSIDEKGFIHYVGKILDPSKNDWTLEESLIKNRLCRIEKDACGNPICTGAQLLSKEELIILNNIEE